MAQEEIDGKIYKGRLDVKDVVNNKIYDYKFGNTVMSKAQLLKYISSHPGYKITIISKFYALFAYVRQRFCFEERTDK